MAKKHQDDIMKKLTDLQPSVPTNTRGLTQNTEKLLNSIVQTEKYDYSDLILQNLTAMETARNVFFEEAQKIYLDIIDNWQKFMNVFYQMMQNNIHYVNNIMSEGFPTEMNKKTDLD